MHTHLLVGLAADSSAESLAFPLPFTSVSRARFALLDRVARVDTEESWTDDDGTAEEEADAEACCCGISAVSRSCSFCLAALTLALERKALELESREDEEADASIASCGVC